MKLQGNIWELYFKMMRSYCLGVMTAAQADMMDMEQKKLLLEAQMASTRKMREIYVGNLAQGQVTSMNLKEFLVGIYKQLPEYHQKYGEILADWGPVRDVKMSGDGMYAFVELWTEELAGM